MIILPSYYLGCQPSILKKCYNFSMFYNDPNIIKLHEKVFVYKNFIPQELVEKITGIANVEQEKKRLDYEIHKIDWYKDKVTNDIPELIEVWDLVSEFLLPTHSIHPELKLLIGREGGGGMFLHCDSPGEDNEHMLLSDDTWSTCCFLDYGAVAYFGDFDGGEIVYPFINVEYKPNPGDLVIHGAHYDCSHEVKEVTRGIRYAYSMFVLPKEKNPGSFYDYGTPEDLERKSNPSEWVEPLFVNPLFAKEEKIRIQQKALEKERQERRARAGLGKR
jgi:hypothetical protein